MKIGIIQKQKEDFWYYPDKFWSIKTMNYIYKDLNIDNCFPHVFIHFTNFKFYKKFNLDLKSVLISTIKTENPEAYEWLKDNFCKGDFYFNLYYNNKQELKKCIKKYIEIEIKMEL